MTKDQCPEIIFLIGPPGSGKTTWLANYFAILAETRKPEDIPQYAIVSTDRMVEERMALHNVDYTTAFLMIPKEESDQLCFNKLYGCLKNNYHIIVDQTNVDKVTRAAKLALVPENYFKRAIVFDLPHEVVLQRINAPERLAVGKVIPDAVMQKMFDTYEEPDLTEFHEIEFITQ
jgi:tRNA uridine 5-carbamoylmethylation protein Kti12